MYVPLLICSGTHFYSWVAETNNFKGAFDSEIWIWILKSGFPISSFSKMDFNKGPLREMVKTIVLRQDPPVPKKTDGLFIYPPSPTLKDGVLFV